MKEEYVDRMVRRRIGLDALRRLRRLVDAAAEEGRDARRAAYLAGVCALALACAIAWVAILR